MARRHVVRGEGATRQRILEAAIKRFAIASYDDTSLRDIATEVGVDVAYVHRSFGSKEGLFADVLRACIGTSGIGDTDLQALPKVLARQLFERSHVKAAHGIEPLHILIRSVLSPTAGPPVGKRLVSEFIEPLRDKLGDETQFRASMIMSMLIGFSILRNLLQLPAVTEIDPAKGEILIASTVERIMQSEDVASLPDV